MDIYQKDLHEESGFKNENPVTGEIPIPVIHEDVSFEKTVVETGKVKVIKTVKAETEELNISLFQEEIDIKTIPVNEFIDTIPAPVRYEGDTMIIPVLKEVSIVRIMLEKEIHITKKKIHTTESKSISLKKEEVKIEKSPHDNYME